MIAGLGFTWVYIAWFKFWEPAANVAENWWFGISPEGIGFVGMIVNFVVAFAVARFTVKPPEKVRELVDSIRIPVRTQSNAPKL